MAKRIDVALTLNDRDFTRGINRAERELDGFEATASGLKGLLGGLFAGIGFGALTSGLVKTYTEFEKTRTVLSTLLGSQQAATQEFERLQRLANSLPQDLQDITDAFVILTRTGMNTSSTALKNFSNIATGTGKSMTQLAEAVADAMTGEFERLKEFGIKVEKQNGKLVASIGGQQAFVANSAQELVSQLEALGATQFGTAAANNAGTLDQSLSNLRGTVYEVTIAFMEGLAPALKISSDNMAEFIKHNKTLIADMGRGVGEALHTVAAGFKLLGENIDLVRNALLTVIALQGFQSLQRILANFSQFLTQFGSFKKMADGIKAFGAALASVNGPLKLIVAGLLAVMAIFAIFRDSTLEISGEVVSLGDIMEAFSLRISRGFSALVDVFANMGESIPLLGALFGVLKAAGVDLLGALGVLGRGAMKVLDKMVKGFILLAQIVADSAQSIIAAFDVVFMTLPRALWEFIKRSGAQIGELWDYVTSGGQDAIENMFAGAGTGLLDDVRQKLQGIKENFTETGEAADFLFNGENMFDLGPMLSDLKTMRDTAREIDALEIDLGGLPERRQMPGAIGADPEAEKRAKKQREQELADRQAFFQNLADEADYWAEHNKKLEEDRARLSQDVAFIQMEAYGEVYTATQRLTEMQAILNEAYAQGIIPLEEYQRLMEKLQENFDLSTGAGSFADGWAQAFEDFKLRVNDAASFGAQMFDTFTSGMSDAIMTFVETGKLSFRSLINDMMRQIIKMLIDKMVMNFMGLFAGGGSGGGGFFSSLFGGARAEGGPVMANKTYLVGERGPELFTPTGSGGITPNDQLGGGKVQQTNVVYNINAVDALSFKQMVAQDPEFIYAVSRAGARRQPGQ